MTKKVKDQIRSAAPSSVVLILAALYAALYSLGTLKALTDLGWGNYIPLGLLALREGIAAFLRHSGYSKFLSTIVITGAAAASISCTPAGRAVVQTGWEDTVQPCLTECAAFGAVSVLSSDFGETSLKVTGRNTLACLLPCLWSLGSVLIDAIDTDLSTLKMHEEVFRVTLISESLRGSEGTLAQ